MVETTDPSPLEAVCQLPSDTLALLLSSVLERLCSLSADSRGTSTRFHSRELNATPVSDYCRRLAQWLPATNDTLLLSLVYARRLVWSIDAPLPASLKPSRHPRPVVNQWTIHRVILSLLSLASKVCALVSLVHSSAELILTVCSLLATLAVRRHGWPRSEVFP